jgi:hypothetical protein
MTNLADQDDATAFGYGTIDSTLFARASARVRGYVRQQITAGESTLVVRGPIVVLPERPVVEIVSIVDRDGDPDHPHTLQSDEWAVRPGSVLETPRYGGNLEVTYRHGFSQLPDELVEVVCSVASRLANVNPAAASGVQQETGGSESVSYGFDSYNAISDLSTGEKRVLDRLFPKRASVVVLRP